MLADAIADIHARSRGTYGILRVKAALEIEQGLIVNTKLVKRIMRELGIQGLPGPKKGTKNLKNARTCEDLVQREFTATRPNELWLTDITEHPTGEGKLYCCAVLDLYSPQGRRLGHRPPLRGRTRPRCHQQGRRVEDDLAGDGDPLGPRQPIHVLGLHRERPAPGAPQLHGHRRRLLRQRPHGVVLGLDADRTPQPAEVADQSRARPSPWPTTSRTSTIRTAGTVRSATSPRTNSRRCTQPPPSRPLCPKKWSTEWGQAQAAQVMGYEP